MILSAASESSYSEPNSDLISEGESVLVNYGPSDWPLLLLGERSFLNSGLRALMLRCLIVDFLLTLLRRFLSFCIFRP